MLITATSLQFPLKYCSRLSSKPPHPLHKRVLFVSYVICFARLYPWGIKYLQSLTTGSNFVYLSSRSCLYLLSFVRQNKFILPVSCTFLYSFKFNLFINIFIIIIFLIIIFSRISTMEKVVCFVNKIYFKFLLRVKALD